MTAALWLLALVACKKDPEPSPTGGTTPPAPPDAWQETATFAGKTGGDGLLQVEVEVAEGVDAFLVSATSPTDFAGLERVIDPNGDVVLHWEDWWTSPNSLTDAFFGWSSTMAFNWPVREEDGPLTPGTWIVELYTAKANGTYVASKLSGTVFSKDDADLGAGSVPVHIVYARDQDTPEVVAAVETAVERWRSIWAARGLTLDETYHTSDLAKDLAFAFTVQGSDDVAALAATLPAGELVLVVGETIDGDAYTYGVAGGIPGTLEPSPYTWVLVGWLTHAGVNGRVNAEEARVMGETMAHEIGHYTGLYHPVECSDDCGEYWDALADTPECVGMDACEADMADNLMYPYTVCSYDGCVPAEVITPDQSGVIHRYLGVK